MSKGRNTRTLGIRVSDSLYLALVKRSEEKEKTLSEYVKDCLLYMVKRSADTIKRPGVDADGRSIPEV